MGNCIFCMPRNPSIPSQNTPYFVHNSNCKHKLNPLLNTESLHASEIKIKGKENFKKIGLSDFHFLKLLGKGTFGQVVLVQKKNTGKIFFYV